MTSPNSALVVTTTPSTPSIVSSTAVAETTPWRNKKSSQPTVSSIDVSDTTPSDDDEKSVIDVTTKKAKNAVAPLHSSQPSSHRPSAAPSSAVASTQPHRASASPPASSSLSAHTKDTTSTNASVATTTTTSHPVTTSKHAPIKRLHSSSSSRSSADASAVTRPRDTSTAPAVASSSSSTNGATESPLASLSFGSFTPMEVSHCLRRSFHHPSIRMPQAKAISSVLRGRDCFVLAPTGGGKSLCYQLPAVLQSQRSPGMVTIVVSPLIALMKDQVDYLKSRDIYAAMLGSSVSASEKAITNADIERRGDESQSDGLPAHLTHDFDATSTLAESSKPRISILFVSPEYLCGDQGSRQLAHLVKQQRLTFIAIDEAHCVSQWGHQFRPMFLKLSFLKIAYPKIPLMLLTATATKSVQNDIIKLLNIDRTQIDIIRGSFNRANICYSVQHKECIKTLEGEEMTIYAHMRKFIEASASLVPTTANPAASTPSSAVAASSSTPPIVASAGSRSPVFGSTPVASSSTPLAPVSCSGIIYSGTRESCDLIAGELRKFKLTASAYHAGMNQKERERVQEQWMRGTIQIIVATVAFGMGIDKANVRFVIHHQLSNSVEGYYQESGRCGRDGLPSNALIYYSQQDISRAQFLAKQETNVKSAQIGAGSVEHRLTLLESMRDFCEATSCRRQILLEYLGEKMDSKQPIIQTLRANKRCCDACSDKEQVQQRLTLAKTIGGVRTSGAGMSDMKSQWVYDGPKTGDEYESSEEHRLTENQLKRRKEEQKDASVFVPKHILLNKKDEGFNDLMDFMAASEARELKKQGIERKIVRTPFNAPAAAAAATKSVKRKPYRGSVLGVNGAHTVADLPVTKREDCFKSLLLALKKNRPFYTPDSSSAPHSATSVCQALEYLTFFSARTNAAYTQAMRALLMNLGAASRKSEAYLDAWKIDWNKIPSQDSQDEEDEEDEDEDEEESSESEDDEEEEEDEEKEDTEMKHRDDDDDEDAIILPRLSVKKSMTGGGFQSASALIDRSVFGSKGHSSHKPFSSTPLQGCSTSSSITYPAGVKPALSSFIAASKLQMATSTGTNRSPLRPKRQTETQMVRTQQPIQRGVVGAKPITTSSAASSMPSSSHSHSHGHSSSSTIPAGASTSNVSPTRTTAAVAATSTGTSVVKTPPPSKSATSTNTSTTATVMVTPTKSRSPVKLKSGGVLSLSFVYPPKTITSTTHQQKSPPSAAAASIPPSSSTTTTSPSRILPLTLTRVSATTPQKAGEKRPRAILDLTESSPEKKQRLETPPSSSASSASVNTMDVSSAPTPITVTTTSTTPILPTIPEQAMTDVHA